jgi:hypothetical protein
MTEDDVTRDSAYDNASTRRSFLKGGAFLAAPIAAAAIPAVALAGDDGLKTRLERLEDEAAIRELHQAWLRRVNAGDGGGPLLDGGALLDHGDGVRRITADHAGAPDKIEIAADGRSAVGNFDYAVETETPLKKDCTLAQMAHAQGNGSLRRSERRLLTVAYTKTRGAWEIVKVASTPL